MSIILMVWLAIGWREAIVVAFVIPMTILPTLFASWITGHIWNRMSMFVMIFSIGILVSDAIDAMDWAPGTKPEITLNGQPADEAKTTLLRDGEWAVTFDMAAAFGVALLGHWMSAA